MESIDLIPMDGDVGKITRRAEEFRDLPEALQRNLQTFLTLTMDALSIQHQKVKSSMAADATKQSVSFSFFKFHRVPVAETAVVRAIATCQA